MRPGVPPSINRAETPGIQHILQALGFPDVDPETIDLVLSKLLGPEGIEMGMPPIMGGLAGAGLGAGAQRGGLLARARGLFGAGAHDTQIAPSPALRAGTRAPAGVQTAHDRGATANLALQDALRGPAGIKDTAAGTGIPGALEQSMIRNQPPMHNTQMSPPPAGMLGPGGTEVGRAAFPRAPVGGAGAIGEADDALSAVRPQPMSRPSAGYAIPKMSGPHGTQMSSAPSGMSMGQPPSMSMAQSGRTGTMPGGPPTGMFGPSGTAVQGGLPGAMDDMTRLGGPPAGVLDRQRRMMGMAGAGAAGMRGAAGAVGSLGSLAPSDLPPSPSTPMGRTGPPPTAGDLYPSLSPADAVRMMGGEGMDPKPKRAGPPRPKFAPPTHGSGELAVSKNASMKADTPDMQFRRAMRKRGAEMSEEDMIAEILSEIGPPPSRRGLPRQ